VLDGAGDRRHEWIELNDRFIHLRRRLTDSEAAIVGPVVDVRRTIDAERRFAAVRSYLPPGWIDVV
jgi:hypothetical protein